MKNKQGSKILLVDDQLHTLIGVSRILSGAGYQTLEARNGEECLRIAKDQKPDLILLDVVLPDIDGMEVCRRIKADPDTTEIFVVLHSAIHVESDSQSEGLEHGADGYIVKPIPNREMLARVESMLRLKYTEKRLRESEERFRKMFEKHDAIMLLIDPVTCTILDANKAAEQFYGYPRSQLRSMPIQGINISPLEQIENEFNSAMEESRNFFVSSHRFADGRVRIVEVRSSPIELDGEIILFSIIQDITDRKCLEQELRQSEAEKFRTVANFTYDWEYWLAPEGHLIWMSPSCERITGYRPDEFINNPALLEEIVYPDDKSLLENVATSLDIPVPHEIDFRIFTFSGEIRWIAQVCLPVFNLEGKYLGLRVSNRDISDRKLAEQELAQSETKYRRIIETANEGFWTMDGQYATTTVNKKMADMIGYAVEEMIGKKVEHFMFDEDLEDHKEKMAGRRQGQTGFYERRFRRKDGTVLWALVSATAIIGKDGAFNGSFAMFTDISSRKLAEERLNKIQLELKVSRDNYRDLYFFAPVGYFTLTEKGIITEVNLAGSSLLGMTRSKIVGQDFESFVAPEDQTSWRNHLVEARIDMVTHAQEFWLKSEGGRNLYVNLESLRMLIPHQPPGKGKDDCVIRVAVTNITDRKLAEEALRSSEVRFRNLFETSDDGIFLSDGLSFIECNTKGLEIFGCQDRGDIVGHTPMEFSPDKQPDGRPSMEKMRDHILAAVNLAPQTFYWRHCRKDGSPFEAEVSLNALLLEGRVHLQCKVRDITERKHSEEKEKRLITAIEQAAEGVVITDPDGIIQYVNSAEESISGYGMSELLGVRADIFKSDKHTEDFYTNLWSTIKAGKVWKGRFVNRKKNGTQYCEDATITPVYDESGNLMSFVSVKQDVTKLLELQQQIFDAQKVEAIGAFAGGFAHDFGNKLQVIDGYLDFVLLNTGLPESVKSDLRMIRKAVDSSTELIKSMMAFSRKSTVYPQSLQLNEIISNLSSMLVAALPKTINIELALLDELWMINAVFSQIDQILMNLALNARDAMPDGGKLTIKTDNTFLDEEFCSIYPTIKPGRYVLLSVEDSGRGMDKDTIKHIFEPFFTTKEDGQGTGLGLAVVHEIVRKCGGMITCDSEPSAGTTFKIYFPASSIIEE